MELWVRSQDKEKLIRTDNIRYMDMSDDYDKETHSIWNNSIGILGTYKSKERALEVLNEIQKLIQPINVLYNAEIDKETFDKIKEYGMVIVKDNARIEKLYDSIVYQMPEE